MTHEEVTKEDLGGAKRHGETSGVSNFICKDEDDCFERVRELLSFIPSHNFAERTLRPTSDPVYRDNLKIKGTVPANPASV